MRLLLDFDGTITKEDTIGELGQAAIQFHRQTSGQDLEPKWTQVVQHYIDGLQKYRTGYHIPECDRLSLHEELQYLEALKHMEEASLQRLEQSGIFGGLSDEKLFGMGRDAVQSGRVLLRDGFTNMMQLARERKWEVAIISVNWSRAFIRGILHPLDLPVIANEIGQDGAVKGPQILGETMTNCTDKRDAMSRVVEQGASNMQTLYFGDSTTDMQCLLEGGIVMSNDETSSLMRTLRRIGVSVPHVGSYQQDAKIHWARNFEEVLDSGILDTQKDEQDAA
ncbi:HAD-like domain-containing protein [Stachybotrys elegans]|uniref:HAD-like domain-containing protein n=1 Tax=Stachybotrys elegans TaxID=80388 RepID=A0A8K0T2C4_9HYPO|nr:HAD-like domain-containing protein [Stachybotrys elegans]